MSEPSEFQIQIAICHNARRYGAPGMLFWHVPNGGKRGAREARTLKMLGVLPGVPDLHFLHQGRLFVLEVKDQKGRLSSAQEELLPRMLSAGACVGVAHSLPRALWYLAHWGLIQNCPLPLDPAC